MAGIATAQVIDVHAHAVLDETMGAAGAHGPELAVDEHGAPFFRVGNYVLQGVKYRGSPFMEVDLRLAAMDAQGIDYQNIICLDGFSFSPLFSSSLDVSGTSLGSSSGVVLSLRMKPMKVSSFIARSSSTTKPPTM